jgi:site-specific DNA-cytosine methylase
MRYIAHVPLIGGFALANMNVTNEAPVAVTSYSPFENNDKLLLTYLKKKGLDVPYFQLDKLAEGNNLNELLSEHIDFVSAVPPCAGLSSCSSLKKGARACSPVNDWMYKSAEFVMSTIKPTIYVFENAPGLYTDAGTPVRNQLIEIAKTHGYAGTFYRTDSILHGIPQKRPRTYTILYKGKHAPILNYFDVPSPHISEYLKQVSPNATLQDAYATKEPFIDDFEIVKFSKEKYGDDWRNQFLMERDHITSYDFLKRRNLLEEYQKYVESQPIVNQASLKDIKHVIKKVDMGKNFRLSHRVLCLDKHHIYAVIGEMMERNVHPTEDRRINIREYMHLMGLPEDFDIADPRDYAKLTQNVPVKTSEDITREIIQVILGNRQFSNDRFLYQNNMKYEASTSKSKSLF